MSGRNCARVITFGFQGVDAFVFDLPARPTAAYFGARTAAAPSNEG
jgi:hypothetical protein